MKASAIYDDVSAKLATMMETADPNDWVMPWHAASFLPTNASTGKTYRGGNVVALWITAEDRGYSGAYWATYRQWSALGRQVRKGERATHCVKWIAREDAKTADKVDDDTRTRSRLIPRGFAVFHYAQTDAAEGCGEPWEPPAPPIGADPIPTADAFVRAVGATMRDGTDAHYNPRTDTVHVPPLAAFTESVAYYATALHELTHWTGHADRLARETLAEYFASAETRAREELTAELGAAFACASLGLTTTPREDHAQYLASWARLLRSDPSAFYKAASAAAKACDYLHDRAGAEIAHAA